MTARIPFARRTGAHSAPLQLRAGVDSRDKLYQYTHTVEL